jgi:hypothetical protein
MSIVMVFSTMLGKISLKKTFLYGKTTYGHNLYVNLWKLMDSTIFIGTHINTKEKENITSLLFQVTNCI